MTTCLDPLNASLAQKERALRDQIAEAESVLVAYSGGTDSAYLAWIAHEVLGDRMLAVIADSPSLPRRELARAVSFAEQSKIPLLSIATEELARPEYARNELDRCFHCKSELFNLMEQQRQQAGYRHIAYGRNLDDDSDFRPGQMAAELHHVIAPLVDAQLRKSEVRELAKQAGLPLWDKPASACLSSRIEYGRPVTRDALAQVEAGEEALHQLGMSQVRVRHHGEIARIEVSPEDFARAFTPEIARTLVPIFKKLGFKYVTLDCEGYRSGSMNEALASRQLLQIESGRDSRSE